MHISKHSKVLVLLLSFLASITTVSAANNLWEFYGGDLPSLTERSITYENVFNETDYRGTAEQNEKLLDFLQYGGSSVPVEDGTLFGAAIPSGVANFETALQSKIDTDDTSMVLVSTTTPDGTVLVPGRTYGFTIDEGESTEEHVIGVASSTGRIIDTLTRGISTVTGTSSVASLQKDHRRGASVKITTAPLLIAIQSILNGEDTFPNLIYYTSGVGCASGSPSTTLCDKSYLDNVVVAGAATSTEGGGGIVDLATLAQQANSTDLGTNDPLVLQAKNSTSTCQVVDSYNIVASSSTGKLDPNCFDSDKGYVFGSETSSTTFIGTSTADRLHVTTGNVRINGVDYVFDNQAYASGTVPTSNGVSGIYPAVPDWRLITSTTTVNDMQYATVTISAATDVQIIFAGTLTNSNDSLGMYFLDASGNRATKHGYKTTFDNLAVNQANGSSASSVTLIATTSQMFYDMRLMNSSGLRKQLVWSSSGNESAALAPSMGEGAVSFDETTAQITTIVFHASPGGAGEVAPAGLITSAAEIRVYGR